VSGRNTPRCAPAVRSSLWRQKNCAVFKGDRTGEALIAAQHASPYRDIDVEPRRIRLPVRDVCHRPRTRGDRTRRRPAATCIDRRAIDVVWPIYMCLGMREGDPNGAAKCNNEGGD
jgi:hypothetical protein